jgi:hypothetical protein
MESQDIKPLDPKDEQLIENKNLSLFEASTAYISPNWNFRL